MIKIKTMHHNGVSIFQVSAITNNGRQIKATYNDGYGGHYEVLGELDIYDARNYVQMLADSNETWDMSLSTATNLNNIVGYRIEGV